MRRSPIVPSSQPVTSIAAAELLGDLTDRGRLGGLPLLDLAAGELPEPGQRGRVDLRAASTRPSRTNATPTTSRMTAMYRPPGDAAP